MCKLLINDEEVLMKGSWVVGGEEGATEANLLRSRRLREK
jgi:hypothetical protein